MNPPHPFKLSKDHGWSLCISCDKWCKCLNFYHEGILWNLCVDDYFEYWFNVDELLDDYKPPIYHKVGFSGTVGRR